jgi:hypothetical protein
VKTVIANGDGDRSVELRPWPYDHTRLIVRGHRFNSAISTYLNSARAG